MGSLSEQGKNLEALLKIREDLERSRKAVKIQIGDSVYMLNQHAKNYKPDEALKEYVSNPLDEKLLGKVPYTLDMKLFVRKDGDNGYIIIEDNCAGMDEKTLSEKLRNPCPQDIDSREKRGNYACIGEKGLGLQAFRRFATNMYIVSKKENSPTYALGEVTITKAEAHTSTCTDQELKKRGDIPTVLTEHLLAGGKGTRVLLTGITERDINNFFTPQKLNHFLGEQYSPLLSNEEIDINVGYVGGKVKPLKVSPIKPVGQLMMSGKVNITNNIYIENNIFYNPHGTDDKVRFHCQGAKLEDIDWEFSRGKLNGTINTNYKNLTGANRNIIAWNSRDPICIKMQTVLDNWKKELSDKLDKREEQSRGDAGNKVMDYLLDILGPIAKEILSRKTLVKSQKSSLEETVSTTGDPAGRLRQKGKGPHPPGPGRNEEVELDIHGTKQPVEEGWRGYARPNCKIQEFDGAKIYLRSMYHAESKTIFVNKSHEDFKKEVGNDFFSDKANDYLLHLLCRELAGAEFRKLCEETKEKDPEQKLDPVFIIALNHDAAEKESAMYIPAKRKLKLFPKKSKKA